MSICVRLNLQIQISYTNASTARTDSPSFVLCFSGLDWLALPGRKMVLVKWSQTRSQSYAAGLSVQLGTLWDFVQV